MARALLIVVLGLLALAPAAGGATRTEILRDCEDDAKLQGTYTAKELRDARNNIGSDTDAYSDCRDVLSSALSADARRRAAARAGATPATGAVDPATGTVAAPATGDGTVGAGGVGPGGTSRPAPPNSGAQSAAENAQLEQVRKTPPVAETLGGRGVVPGAAGQSAAATTLPTSLLTVLVLLALCAVAVAGTHVRRRVLRRRTA